MLENSAVLTFKAILLFFFFSLITSIFGSGCVDKKSKLEKNAVIVDIRITPEEASNGTHKVARAPDGKIYTLIIPKGVKNKTPLKLPPRVAKLYEYPLYFRVNILGEGESRPDDLLNRKKRK